MPKKCPNEITFLMVTNKKAALVNYLKNIGTPRKQVIKQKECC